MLDDKRLADWGRMAAIEFAIEATVGYVVKNMCWYKPMLYSPQEFTERVISDNEYEMICMANLIEGVV